MIVTVLMGGDNIHGRLMVDEMIKAGIPPSLIINEENTDRALKLSDWLKNDIDNPPSVKRVGSSYRGVSAFDGSESLEAIREAKTDYLVIAGCGAIIKDPILKLATPLNIHPGLLPFFRGLDPVLWSVFQEKPVGATVHIMDKGIDTGPILLSSALPPEIQKPCSQDVLRLRLACMRWGGSLLARFLKSPQSYPPQMQDESAAAYYGAFPEDLKLSLEEKIRLYQHAS